METEKEENLNDITLSGPKTSMMVVDVRLSDLLDIKVASSLFPVVRSYDGKDDGGKKLPHCSPGTIVSTDYGGFRRGFLRNTRGKKYFKNSVCFDISCTNKNINGKLSLDNIHLCGITSEEMIDEVSDYIIKYIREIQTLLKFVSENPKEKDKTISWLKDVTQGHKVTKTSYITLKNSDLRIKKNITDYFIRPLSKKDMKDAPNEKLAKLYTRVLDDLFYHSDYVTFLNWVSKITYISEPTITKKKTIIQVKNTNTKLNFNVGVCIDFVRIFIEKFPEYRVFYDNVFRPSTIKITISYDSSVKPDRKPNDSDKNIHTFLLQYSGSFTHSGPGEEEQEKGYYNFLKTMRVMKALIQSLP